LLLASGNARIGEPAELGERTLGERTLGEQTLGERTLGE
jgi:hypothetical protein